MSAPDADGAVIEFFAVGTAIVPSEAARSLPELIPTITLNDSLRVPHRPRHGVTRCASVRFDPMRLVATDSAVDFIQEHGGRLYIWMKRNRCCGGSYSTLGAATAAPPKTEFQCVDENVGFELYVPAALLGRLPDELHFEVRRLPRRIEAYWNGCAWIV